jgi:hypothetical protein
MESQWNNTPEYILTLSCLKIISAAVIGYISLILGFEIGGLLRGYRGLGLYIHGVILERVQNLLFPPMGKGKK